MPTSDAQMLTGRRGSFAILSNSSISSCFRRAIFASQVRPRSLALLLVVTMPVPKEPLAAWRRSDPRCREYRSRGRLRPPLCDKKKGRSPAALPTPQVKLAPLTDAGIVQVKRSPSRPLRGLMTALDVTSSQVRTLPTGAFPNRPLELYSADHPLPTAATSANNLAVSLGVTLRRKGSCACGSCKHRRRVSVPCAIWRIRIGDPSTRRPSAAERALVLTSRTNPNPTIPVPRLFQQNDMCQR